MSNRTGTALFLLYSFASFTDAAPPAIAEPLVEMFKDALASYGLTVAGGVFGAYMQVELVNAAAPN